MSEQLTECGKCGWHLKVPEAFKPGWVLCVRCGHETHVKSGCVWGKPMDKPLPPLSDEEKAAIDSMFINWDTLREKGKATA